MTIELIPGNLRRLYEVREWKHACAILKNDFPAEWKDIIEALSAFRLRKTDIKAPGGGKSRGGGCPIVVFGIKDKLYTEDK